MLLDGRLTVRDLDDKEVQKMRVKGADGTFNGRSRRLPSHLAQAFAAEQVRRATEDIRKALPTATREALRILNDPDVSEVAKIGLIKEIWNRNLGKTPEVVRIEGQSKFDQILDAAILIDRGEMEEAQALLDGDLA